MLPPLAVARAVADAGAAEDEARIRAEEAAELASMARTAEAERRAEVETAVEEAMAARDVASGAAAAVGKEVEYRMAVAAEWRSFVQEPLRRTRAEMRRRGMLLPPVPKGLSVDEQGAGRASDNDVTKAEETR